MAEFVLNCINQVKVTRNLIEMTIFLITWIENVVKDKSNDANISHCSLVKIVNLSLSARVEI